MNRLPANNIKQRNCNDHNSPIDVLAVMVVSEIHAKCEAVAEALDDGVHITRVAKITKAGQAESLKE